MPLADLSVDEKEVILECLKCIAGGNVVAHDWEFQTLFGVEVADIFATIGAWPDIDDADEAVYLAINNSMNSLLGLTGELSSEQCRYAKATILEVYQKWKGRPVGSYFDGLE